MGINTIGLATNLSKMKFDNADQNYLSWSSSQSRRHNPISSADE